MADARVGGGVEAEGAVEVVAPAAQLAGGELGAGVKAPLGKRGDICQRGAGGFEHEAADCDALDRFFRIQKRRDAPPQLGCGFHVFRSALVRQRTDAGNRHGVLVIDELNGDLILASRNLPKVDVLLASEVDPVSLVAFEKVIVTEAAVKKLEERLQ